ncbi:hypothetical protein Q9L58_010609 [Maublancomyces gigas]|uniref:Uncharacterized protein n=1 Tax=Discina gigas TaxID=1032678 RepID=A0ABR3G3V8_9PEZI
MIAQDKLFGLASQHTSILAGHTKKLKEIEEWWPAERREGMQTRMVETDKLMIQASKAQAEWTIAAEIAKSAVADNIKNKEDNVPILEELDRIRRSCQAIIFNVAEKGTAFEDTNEVFHEIAYHASETTKVHRRKYISPKPRPIIVLLPTPADVVALLKKFDLYAASYTTERPPFHIKKDQTVKQVALSKKGAVNARTLVTRGIGDFRNRDGRIHQFIDGKFAKSCTDQEIKDLLARAQTRQDGLPPLRSSSNRRIDTSEQDFLPPWNGRNERPSGPSISHGTG